MILSYINNTDENEADLAIFLVPLGGIFAKLSIIALELDYFVVVMDPLPLWRAIRRGPA